MSARDDYPLIAELADDGSNPALQTEASDALAGIDRFNDLMSADIGFRDIEMKMRDGTMNLNTISSQDDLTSRAVFKFLAAMMYHALLGEDAQEPPNYRSGHVRIKPAGAFEEIECAMEVRLTGGRNSSHDIRLELETALRKVIQQIPEDDIRPGLGALGNIRQIAEQALERYSAPPQPPTPTEEADWK